MGEARIKSMGKDGKDKGIEAWEKNGKKLWKIRVGKKWEKQYTLLETRRRNLKVVLFNLIYI